MIYNTYDRTKNMGGAHHLAGLLYDLLLRVTQELKYHHSALKHPQPTIHKDDRKFSRISLTFVWVSSYNCTRCDIKVNRQLSVLT